MYTIVIQLGAILCLPIYFRARIAKFLSTFPRGERGDRTVLTHPLSLTIVAFVVTAIPSLLLAKVIGKHLENLRIMGAALVIGGIVMWIVDAMNAQIRSRRTGRAAGTHSHLAHGRNEPRPGRLDRCVRNSLRRLPGDVALHVHHHRRTARGNVARLRSRVFILSLDARHGRRNPATTF